MNQTHFLLFLVFVLFFQTEIFADFYPNIKINKGIYADYYHMQYRLEGGKYQVNKEYGYNAGGQFEVLVQKQYFPLPAPDCNKDIVISMPESHIDRNKRDLYKSLLENQDVNVVLELNPYFTVIKKNPIRVKLYFCNIFFRQKHGDYYNHL